MQSEENVKLVVLFDMDGVLCLGEKPFENAQRRALIELKAEGCLHPHIDIHSESFKAELQVLTIGRSTIQIYFEMVEKFFVHENDSDRKKSLCQKLSSKVNQYNVEEIQAIHKDYLIQDTVTVFIECAKQDLPMAIVTGSLKPVAQKTLQLIAESVHDAELKQKILAIPTYTPEDYHPHSKPQPGPYLHAKARIEHTHAMVIEDSLSGAKAAIAAGCRTFVRTDNHAVRTDLEAWKSKDEAHQAIAVSYHEKITFDLIEEHLQELQEEYGSQYRYTI